MHTGIRKPVCGTPPSLNLKPGQDVTFSTDFRQVYATVLKGFLKTDPAKVLGKADFRDVGFA
jgi:hypothetical protein